MTELAFNSGEMAKGAEAFSDPESELMQRLRRGESEALTELVHQYGPGLQRLIGRMTAWSSDADDILQEVFLTAWQRAGQFRGQGALEGWLRRLAVNRCKNHHRARRAFKDLLLRFASVAPRQPGNHEEIQSGLAEALAKLKDADRMVLVLYYLEGLSANETADSLGLRVDAVHMRLHRARSRLREVFERMDRPNE